jgi:hypothetical protein
MMLRVDSDGSGLLAASHAHWLYALFCYIRDEWLDHDVAEFTDGKTLTPSFPWLRNLSDFFVGSLRHARHFSPEAYIRQLARQGCSYVTINGLGAVRPFESGPPGDVYSWFYDYSPDLDQFVDSFLLKGYYPRDYLQSNLNLLKANAALARNYGLIPGLHINSPRSMPEEFWQRYGFLRGARVDHPRETLRPRYTLAMAHPVVQEHYRELVRNIMREVPEIGFMHVWTNDSGSGFEFVTSLYAGRNGGPYLLREWKNDDEIARAAAANVLTYYRLLSDEAKKVNHDFRLICDLGPFFAERKYIVPGLGGGIDAGEFGYFEGPQYEQEQRQLSDVGAWTHVKLDMAHSNVVGASYPQLVYERLQEARAHGTCAVLTGATPASLAPFDINGEVVRAIQFQPDVSLNTLLHQIAVRWVGVDSAPALIRLWEHSNTAVRNYPSGVPCSTFGFPWFRFWVRPFVPNIDAIPESERRYYEDFLIATFNNPARVDFNNDMMWNFLSVQEAEEKKSAIDTGVLPPLTQALHECSNLLSTRPPLDRNTVFSDLKARLLVLRCFCTTMRNTLAWTASVHGYLEAQTSKEKDRCRTACRAMVINELENARTLLEWWETSDVDCLPISSTGETAHIYGENFGDLLKKKIALMERHMNEEPFIDPDYMWRMPTIH